MYENCAIQHPRDSYRTRKELEEQIDRRLIQTREDHYSQEKEEVVGRRNTSEKAILMSYFDHEARQRKGGVLAGQ
jgi:DNA-binding TFAR19-related protein (PDSD5 family)